MIRDSLCSILLTKSNVHNIDMQMTDLEFTSHTCKGSIVLSSPVAKAGKKSACGLYVALLLH